MILLLHSDVDCKRTPSGIEYLGYANTTSGGDPCQAWAKVPSTRLPFGTRDSNVNYCRTAMPIGHRRLDFMEKPWCYNLSGIPSPCNITYCGKAKFCYDIDEV